MALRPGVHGGLGGLAAAAPVWCSSSAPGASRPRRTRPRGATRTASPSRPPSPIDDVEGELVDISAGGAAVRVPKGTLPASGEVEVALPGAAPIELATVRDHLDARRLLRRRLAPDPVRRLDGLPDAVALAVPHPGRGGRRSPGRSPGGRRRADRRLAAHVHPAPAVRMTSPAIARAALPRGQFPTRWPTLWLWYLLAGLAALAAYYLLPDGLLRSGLSTRASASPPRLAVLVGAQAPPAEPATPLVADGRRSAALGRGGLRRRLLRRRAGDRRRSRRPPSSSTCSVSGRGRRHLAADPRTPDPRGPGRRPGRGHPHGVPGCAVLGAAGPADDRHLPELARRRRRRGELPDRRHRAGRSADQAGHHAGRTDLVVPAAGHRPGAADRRRHRLLESSPAHLRQHRPDRHRSGCCRTWPGAPPRCTRRWCRCRPPRRTPRPPSAGVASPRSPSLS